MEEGSQTIFIIVITLLCSAFFSGMEIAFISANLLKIELDKQKGGVSGRILSFFVKNTSHLISTMLLGNNASLVIYSLFMAIALQPLLEELLANEALILLVQTICSTLVVLVTAEFLPKAFFRINPNRSLRYGAIPLYIFYWIGYLPTVITMAISTFVLKRMKVDISASKQAFSKVDLDHYVRDINNRMKEETALENEIQILQNALEFAHVKARDCMVPRTEITALNIDDDIEKLKALFITSGFSKIVIYKDSIDHVIGYVHVHEMFSKPETIKQVLLPVLIVPEAALVKEVLQQLTRKKRSIAVVVDEYGGTSGMLTIEDAIEEIFGEIEDEHDTEVTTEQQIDKNTYLFSGRVRIDDLQQEYAIPIPENKAYETVAGYIIHQLEEIPKPNTSIETDRFVLTVVEVSEAKIERIKIEIKE